MNLGNKTADNSQYRIALFSLTAISFVVLSYFYIRFTVDDAFITFRYGKQLVEQGVWNWNPDHNLVEAYTSFSYAVLSIIPVLLKINTVFFFKAVSILIAFLFFRISTQHASGLFPLTLALVLMFANPVFYTHLYSGLETPLFVLLVYAVFLYVLERDRIAINYMLLFCMLLLLALTRPEGGVYMVTVPIYLMVRDRDTNHGKVFIALMLVFGLYYLARWGYFGHFFPNTFYAKSNGELLHNLKKIKPALALAWGCPLMYYLFTKVEQEARRKRFVDISFLVALTVLVYYAAYAHSNLLQNYVARFQFHLFFPLFLAIIVTWKRVSNKYIVIFILLSTLFYFGDKSKRDIFTIVNSYPRLINSYSKLAEKLSAYSDRGYSILLGDAGMVPFISNWKTVDYWGLCSVRVSHSDKVLEFFEEMRPDIILVIIDDEDKWGWEFASLKDTVSYIKKHRSEYIFVKGVHYYKRAKWTYNMNAYVRKDNPDALNIIADIKAARQHSLMKNGLSEKEFFMENISPFEFLK